MYASKHRSRRYQPAECVPKHDTTLSVIFFSVEHIFCGRQVVVRVYRCDGSYVVALSWYIFFKFFIFLPRRNKNFIIFSVSVFFSTPYSISIPWGHTYTYTHSHPRTRSVDDTAMVLSLGVRTTTTTATKHDERDCRHKSGEVHSVDRPFKINITIVC